MLSTLLVILLPGPLLLGVVVPVRICVQNIYIKLVYLINRITSIQKQYLKPFNYMQTNNEYQIKAIVFDRKSIQLLANKLVLTMC